jgi:hypothetical protein
LRLFEMIKVVKQKKHRKINEDKRYSEVRYNVPP